MRFLRRFTPLNDSKARRKGGKLELACLANFLLYDCWKGLKGDSWIGEYSPLCHSEERLKRDVRIYYKPGIFFFPNQPCTQSSRVRRLVIIGNLLQGQPKSKFQRC